MKGAKLLMVTSLASGEGKTLFALSLAYAYSMINKKVLLIDGNFENPRIKAEGELDVFFEDYINGNITVEKISKESKINILPNKGGDVSLFELSDENNIKEKLNSLKTAYDIIIVEITSLNTLNKSKEWILFADKVVGVFEANQSLSFFKKELIDYLKTLDNKFIGWVMNKTVKNNYQKQPK
jgi:Mrp family chromosome partitioning ATPase